MNRTRLRIIGAAAIAAVVAGGGAAFATTRAAADSPSTAREAFLADVAGRLGVSVDDLKKAFKDAAAARGWKRGPFMGPGFGPHPGHRHAVRQAFEAAGSYLGLSREELMSRLRSGQSLAQIAEAEGKSVDGLQQAIHDAIVKQLDAGVTAGRLTQEQKQKLVDRLDAVIDDLVQRSRPPRPERGGASF